MGRKNTRAPLQWRTMDIHIHTPASSDYQQPDVSYLDVLQRAENRGLDIIAFTDHNTIAGYRRMMEEIEQLELLEKLNRLMPEEKNRLSEYRRLLNKLLVLPGIEFTATFGFHIMALFSPKTSVREIEHLLLTLNIPGHLIDDGSATVGATTDVLTAYRLMNQAGAIVIAAHANSSNGVAMRGIPFGGQTKIAYTQDPNLHALEVTDLEQKGPRTTAAFFNGTKPEYPRRMHCIQGSDSHRLITDPQRKKNPGIGDKATDVLLSEMTFEALKEVFLGNDFNRTRPHRHVEEPVYDFIQSALEDGPNIIQDFHESMTVRGGKLYAILADICAFANTNGGTLFIGLSSEQKKAPAGIVDPENSISSLEKEINKRISPPLTCTFDINEYKGKKTIRVLIPRGDDPPYAVDDNKIYVRDEAETGLAVRDEIVNLVLRGKSSVAPQSLSTPSPKESITTEQISPPGTDSDQDDAPRTGVEVLLPISREGVQYFNMRDLRNGNIVKNVTRTSARKLWHYAITQYAEVSNTPEKQKITWHGDYGLLRKYKQGKTSHLDLIKRSGTSYRYYFGVTPNGIHGPWKIFLGEDE